MGEEAAKIANNILNRSTASPGPKKGGKEPEAKKDVKKGVGIHIIFSIEGSAQDYSNLPYIRHITN